MSKGLILSALSQLFQSSNAKNLIANDASGNPTTVPVTVDSSGNVVTTGTVTVGNGSSNGHAVNFGQVFSTPFSLKNRVKNGDILIDQRQQGAAITPASSAYTVDRWLLGITQASKLTVQQNKGAISPPLGFSKYLGITASTAYTPGTSDYFSLQQAIEGYDVRDLGWGTSNAQPVSLQFQVNTSVAGTYSGFLKNSAGTRTYPFTFQVNSTNTWTPITIPNIPGDTQGVWATDNTAGIWLGFSLGQGSTYSGTANSWNAGSFTGVAGSVNLVANSGANFYITGVQLEKGSMCTAFDIRPFQLELAMCQRYFERMTSSTIGGGWWSSTTSGNTIWNFLVPKRSIPSCASFNVTSAVLTDGLNAGNPSALIVSTSATLTAEVIVTGSSYSSAQCRPLLIRLNSAVLTADADM